MIQDTILDFWSNLADPKSRIMVLGGHGHFHNSPNPENEDILDFLESERYNLLVPCES